MAMYHELKEMRQKSATIGLQALEKHSEITSETTEARALEIETEVNSMLEARDALESRIAFAQKLSEVEASFAEEIDPRRPSENRSVRGAQAGMTEAEAYTRWLGTGTTDATLRAGSAFIKDTSVWTPALEARAQSEGTPSAGGYLVPVDLANEIIISLKMAGPMMDPNFCRVISTATGATLNWPTLDDTSNQGYLITENQQVTSNSVALGQVPIQAYKFSTGVVQYSSELVQDAAFDVAQFITDAMVVRAGRVANQFLTTGTGSLQPNGILTAIGNAAVSTANTAAISFDDIVDLEHTVDPLYRNNPKTRFQFHDSTFKALRLIKDNYGRYIWEPATQLGAEATLFGYKYAINQAMPTYGTGSGAKVVVFGDHNVFLVRVVKEFATRRLVERYADYDQDAIIGFLRIDSNLLDRSGKALNTLALS